MHETNHVEPSEAAERRYASPRKRRFRLQWSLQTLLLLTAAVAVWVAYVPLRQQIRRLEREIDAMQEMAGELIVEDSEQIAVVMLPQMWYDESRWEIYLPEGEYVMRLATRRIDTRTREIDKKGLAHVVGESPISAGRHRIELLRSEDGRGQEITVLFDDRPVIEAEEAADWDPGCGSVGGSPIGRCAERPADEPLVLFHRRFQKRLKNGGSTSPKGPTEGLMLWIEPADTR